MQRERRGKNVVHQLSVTSEDLPNSATRNRALQKNVICDKCKDQGSKKGVVELAQLSLFAIVFVLILDCTSVLKVK
uniref:Uncharacterized protein n=1 Tax=Ursus americanus TaxID=9643 RepID=A0A452QZX1_URSAM